MTKTKAELDDLKAQWKADPCWDIAGTEGFEDHIEELERYQSEYYDKLQADESKRVADKCVELGCSPALLEYIEIMEYKIKKLQGE